MTSTTLKELRAQARELGIKGYSKLRKAELERLIAAERARYGKTKPQDRPAQRAPELAETRAPRPVGVNEEQRVETAKYAVGPAGVTVPPHPITAGLTEEIDRLPPIVEPRLQLLPQKPGILHAYWRLAPGTLARQHGLKLRLCRARHGGLEVVEEIVLPGDGGHWYFHVPEESEPGAYYAQLGYYSAGGEFVSAFRRAIARIPSLYASTRIDRRWWMSDEQFRAMYLRAGGFLREARLGWAGSIGSPAYRAVAPGEHLLWPGGISSR